METNMTVGSFQNSDAGDEGGWANFDDTPPAMFSGHGHGTAPGWTSFDDATPSIASTVVDQSAEMDSLKAQLADALASNRRLTEQLSAAVDTISTLRGEVDSLKRGPSRPCRRPEYLHLARHFRLSRRHFHPVRARLRAP